MKYIKKITLLALLATGLNTSADMPIGSNFWFLTQLANGDSWSGEAPFKNNMDWNSAYQFNWSTKLSNVDPWNPVFLAEVQPYRCLRLMDWAQVNRGGLRPWDSRRQPTDNHYGITDSEGAADGMAWEWQIDLANRLQRDLWITIPAAADNAYMWNLATLIKERLHPDRKLYLEYYNEFWLDKPVYGFSFSHIDYAASQADILGFGGAGKFQKATNWYVNRSAMLWKLFEWNMGPVEYNKRIRAIISGQSANPGTGTMARDALASNIINPHNAMPYAYSVAPYFGQEDDLSANSWANLDLSIARTIAHTKTNRETWEGLGVKLVCYEGGQHIVEGVHGGVVALNKNWRMHNRYRWSYLPGIASEIGGWNIFNHYTHVGTFVTWDKGTPQFWGSKEYTGQSVWEEGSYKNRALLEYMGSL